jgi:type IV pilus assembly protein PilY1
LANDRVILTLRPDTNLGTPFRWGSIATSQQTSLGNEDVLNYLRGDKSCEQTSLLICVSGNKTLRGRNKILGDIIHSAATYVSGPNKFYNFDNYGSFAASKADRTPVVYVGANDGMLHGFNAEVTSTGGAIPLVTGTELMAFVPSILFERLPDLSDPTYSHQYYVDSTPTVGDAHYGSGWHTVLVSGLGAGGQEIFALDVTDPAAFSDANAASLVLWEFTDKDDADLGYTFSEPGIGKMADDQFAAVFGNGYNSTVDDTAMGGLIGTGEAVLYVANIQTGAVTKISTGVGSIADPNGLSTPTLVDVDADFIIDYAYAGDLHGNLWRFDLTSSNPAQWKVSFAGSPLFTASSPTGTPRERQPITSQPAFNFRSGGQGYMVYFGTGKYLETTDNETVNQPTQTFYGIWDKWSKTEGEGSFSAITRGDLLQQSILNEITVRTTEVRVTSDNTADWLIHQGWYMDLIDTSINLNLGERQVSKSMIRNGKIYFSTLIPGAEVCEAGGTGWLMILNASDGSRLNASPFDVNGDGIFDANDNINYGAGTAIAISGTKSKSGIISAPTLIEGKGGLTEFIGIGNSSGLVGLGDIFPTDPGSLGGGTPPPPGPGPTPVVPCDNCDLVGVNKGIPFGRILWQQLK